MVDDSYSHQPATPVTAEHEDQNLARNWPALAAAAMWLYTQCQRAAVRCCCGAPTKDDTHNHSMTLYRDDESESAVVPPPMPRCMASSCVSVEPAAVSAQCAATPGPDPHIALNQTQ